MANKIIMRVPDNWHCHLREALLLIFMIKWLVRSGFRGRVLAEPNTTKAILDHVRLKEYKLEVQNAIRSVCQGGVLEPTIVYSIQITEDTTPEMIYAAHAAGVRVAKVYPRFVTTNSLNGVLEYRKILPALRAAAECGWVVQFHCEEI